jgi:hypothetical protein
LAISLGFWGFGVLGFWGFWGGYTFDVNESFGITPYGEVNFNNDFETADKIVGVKTEYKF